MSLLESHITPSWCFAKVSQYTCSPHGSIHNVPIHISLVNISSSSSSSSLPPHGSSNEGTHSCFLLLYPNWQWLQRKSHLPMCKGLVNIPKEKCCSFPPTIATCPFTYNFTLFICVNMLVWLPHVSKLQSKTSSRQPNVYTFSLAMICNIQAAKIGFLTKNLIITHYIVRN